MKATVLLMNFSNKSKLEILKGIIMKENIIPKEVSREEYGQTIGALAGIKELYDEKAVYNGEEIGQEMMIFAGVEDSVLDLLLADMRKKNVRVNYKAVMTPYNIAWKIPSLYEELAKEHAEMTRMYGEQK